MLAADRLMASPRLYATFLLWLLSELFEELPEIGDPDKPVLCFFFDEAHLLFDDAPPGLLEKVEQVVRLIRSKGVGVYFITQNPIDIPDKVAAQLNNRIQHKLNAFTPRDQQAVKAAADTFRVNPAIDVATAITELKIGEALVSLLQPDGSPAAGPTDADQAAIDCGSGRSRRKSASVIITTDAIGAKYDTLLDREVGGGNSQGQGATKPRPLPQPPKLRTTPTRRRPKRPGRTRSSPRSRHARRLPRLGSTPSSSAKPERQRRGQRARGRPSAREAAKPSMADKMMQSAGRSIASSVGRQIGNQLLRGIFGGFCVADNRELIGSSRVRMA